MDTSLTRSCARALTHKNSHSTLNLCTVCVPQVKENICKEGFVVDKDDNSLTRSDAYMIELFDKAGLEIVLSQKQVRAHSLLDTAAACVAATERSAANSGPKEQHHTMTPCHPTTRNTHRGTSPRSCLRCACTRCGRGGGDSRSAVIWRRRSGDLESARWRSEIT